MQATEEGIILSSKCELKEKALPAIHTTPSGITTDVICIDEDVPPNVFGPTILQSLWIIGEKTSLGKLLLSNIK